MLKWLNSNSTWTSLTVSPEFGELNIIVCTCSCAPRYSEIAHKVYRVKRLPFNFKDRLLRRESPKYFELRSELLHCTPHYSISSCNTRYEIINSKDLREAVHSLSPGCPPICIFCQTLGLLFWESSFPRPPCSVDHRLSLPLLSGSLIFWGEHWWAGERERKRDDSVTWLPCDCHTHGAWATAGVNVLAAVCLAADCLGADILVTPVNIQ